MVKNWEKEYFASVARKMAEALMNSGISESAEFLHLVAEGIPEAAAAGAVWIDRAYQHLARNGMDGARAYAQATVILVSNGFDLDDNEPEAVVDYVLDMSLRAQQHFATLDPINPAASYYLQRRAGDQRKSS